MLEGRITAYSENISSSLILVIDFVRDFVPVNESEEETDIITTCGELEGNVCSENQECNGESVYAKDGVCCLQPAECEELKTGNSTARWIGWGLLVVALLFLYWFYKKKYRRVERKRPF